MQIIISPTKKMQVNNDVFAHKDLPLFLTKTQQVLSCLQTLSFEQLQKLYQASDSIVEENRQRLVNMDLTANLTAAIMAYEGIAFSYMSSKLLTQEDYDFLQEHLFILSGFYGALRPFDGIRPYRLEMQAKLVIDSYPNLYNFWHDEINNLLESKDKDILNLASKEYSKIIDSKRFNIKTVRFVQEHKGKLVEKGTVCKMLRGLMVKYIATHKINDFEAIKSFNENNAVFNESLSNENTFVFIC